MRENTENHNSPPREALNSFSTAEVDNFNSNMCKSSIERLLLSNDNLWRASEIDKIKHNSTGYKNLDNILKLIGEIDAAPTEGMLPMAHPLDLTQPLRDDVCKKNINRDANQHDCSKTQDGYYTVPKILD